MRTPYSAAKWAVVGFTQSLAAEAGPDKVRVNCIQPGIVEGERIDRVIAAKAKGLGVPKKRSASKMVEGMSMQDHRHRRRTSPTWRCSSPPRRAGTSRGQAISVCGGTRYLVSGPFIEKGS